MSCEEEFVPAKNADTGIAAASMPVTVNTPAFDIDTSCDGVTAAGRFDPLPTHSLPDVSAAAMGCALPLVLSTVAEIGTDTPLICATVTEQDPGVLVTSPVSAMNASHPNRPFASEGIEVQPHQFAPSLTQPEASGL